MADDQTPQKAPNILITDAELHYKSLTDYFKFLVTLTLAAIGILTTAGLYVGYKDMAGMRAEVRQPRRFEPATTYSRLPPLSWP